jgi:hypothetical protein
MTLQKRRYKVEWIQMDATAVSTRNVDLLIAKPPKLNTCDDIKGGRTTEGRVQLKCDGTRRRTGGEVKGKLANWVGSQYSSHYLGTWCIQHYYRWCAKLGCQWTDAPADLNGLVRFAERRNLVSARVPSHFKRSLVPHRGRQNWIWTWKTAAACNALSVGAFSYCLSSFGTHDSFTPYPLLT